MNCRQTPPPDALFFIRVHRGSSCLPESCAFFRPIVFVSTHSVFTDLAQCPGRGRDKWMLGSLDLGMTWACYCSHVGVCGGVTLHYTGSWSDLWPSWSCQLRTKYLSLGPLFAVGGVSVILIFLSFSPWFFASQEQFWLAEDLRWSAERSSKWKVFFFPIPPDLEKTREERTGDQAASVKRVKVCVV